MSRHVTETLPAPIAYVLGLIDTHHIFCDGGHSKHVEASKDALIWEVQMAVAVATVLLDHLLLWALLHNMPLFMAVVA